MAENKSEPVKLPLRVLADRLNDELGDKVRADPSLDWQELQYSINTVCYVLKDVDEVVGPKDSPFKSVTVTEQDIEAAIEKLDFLYSSRDTELTFKDVATISAETVLKNALKRVSTEQTEIDEKVEWLHAQIETAAEKYQIEIDKIWLKHAGYLPAQMPQSGEAMKEASKPQYIDKPFIRYVTDFRKAIDRDREAMEQQYGAEQLEWFEKTLSMGGEQLQQMFETAGVPFNITEESFEAVSSKIPLSTKANKRRDEPKGGFWTGYDYIFPHDSVCQGALKLLDGSGMEGEYAKKARTLIDQYDEINKAYDDFFLYEPNPLETLHRELKEKFSAQTIDESPFSNEQSREAFLIAMHAALLNIGDRLAAGTSSINPFSKNAVDFKICRDKLEEVIEGIKITDLKGGSKKDAYVAAHQYTGELLKAAEMEDKTRNRAGKVLQQFEKDIPQLVSDVKEKQKDAASQGAQETREKASVRQYIREKKEAARDRFDDFKDRFRSGRSKNSSSKNGSFSEKLAFLPNVVVGLLGVGAVGASLERDDNDPARETEENWFKRNFKIDGWSFLKAIAGLGLVAGADYALRGEKSMVSRVKNNVSSWGQGR